MALEKLKIHVESKPIGKNLQFNDNDIVITALFNPDKMVFSKSANWGKQEASHRDAPELQFTGAEPRTLKLDLLFDTFDPENEDNKDKDVRKLYTDKIFHLITVKQEKQYSDKHRPPACRLSWGAAGMFFQGVLQSLEQQFTLFTENGTPVRAKLSCTFKEWHTNYDDLNEQGLQSSDIVKMRVVKRGDTLSTIAGEEYLDPQLWRPIAVENGIDNPLELSPGMLLLVPTLSKRGLW